MVRREQRASGLTVSKQHDANDTRAAGAAEVHQLVLINSGVLDYHWPVICGDARLRHSQMPCYTSSHHRKWYRKQNRWCTYG